MTILITIVVTAVVTALVTMALYSFLAREKKITLALTNAFGFGGHNAVLAIRKYS